ncbi:MAG: hypothetical protein ACLGI2_00040 [Acidimicrobiia bacterium]
MLAVAALFFVACGDDGETAGNGAEQRSEEAAGEARAAARDAWASVRTDAERLIDEIRTQDAPRLKEQLLDRCRDALERLREAGSDRSDEADRLCDRVRDTDVTSTDAWADIRRQIEQLEPAG